LIDTLADLLSKSSVIDEICEFSQTNGDDCDVDDNDENLLTKITWKKLLNFSTSLVQQVKKLMN